MKTEPPRPPPPAGASQPQKSAGDHELLTAALQHHWPLLKTELKEQYLVLTDDDLVYAEGQEDEFLDHLERKTCRPRREFEAFIVSRGAHFS